MKRFFLIFMFIINFFIISCNERIENEPNIECTTICSICNKCYDNKCNDSNHNNKCNCISSESRAADYFANEVINDLDLTSIQNDFIVNKSDSIVGCNSDHTLPKVYNCAFEWNVGKKEGIDNLLTVINKSSYSIITVDSFSATTNSTYTIELIVTCNNSAKKVSKDFVISKPTTLSQYLTINDVYSYLNESSSGKTSDKAVFVKGLVIDAGNPNKADNPTANTNVLLADNSEESNKLKLFTLNYYNNERFYKGDILYIRGYYKNAGSVFCMTENNSLTPEIVLIERGTSNIVIGEHSNATVTNLSKTSGLNNSEFTFNVSADNGYKVSKVKVNGQIVLPEDSVYTSKIQGTTTITVESILEGESELQAYKTANFATFIESDPSTSDYTNTSAYLRDQITFTTVGFSNFNKGFTCIKCGRKKATSINSITTSVIDKEIKQISIVFDINETPDKINSAKIYVYSDAQLSNEVLSKDFTNEIKVGCVDISLNNNQKNAYYKIVFDIDVAGGNGVIGISKITFYSEQ